MNKNLKSNQTIISKNDLIGNIPVADDNWDFKELSIKHTQYLTHFFHHWAAKFIPQIPQNIIHKFARTGDVVLDPFSGCGTTMVEAKLLNCHSYAIDINPLAIKICEAKVNKIDDKTLTGFISWLDRYNKLYRQSLKREQLQLFENENSPNDSTLFEGSDKWFRSDVAKSIKIVIQKIRNYESHTRNFIEVGLSDLLKGMSNARSDRTVPSLPKKSEYHDRKHDRIIDNNIRQINVFQRLSSQLKRMQCALQEFHRITNDGIICQPILADAKNLIKYVKRANVVVTSPPYWSAQNYQKLHFLSFRVLGLAEPGQTEIGINASAYLDDLEVVIKQLSQILDGIFAIVIGESKDGIHETVKALIVKHGMKEQQIIKRNILNHTFFAKAVQKEYIYIYRNTPKRKI